MPSNTRRKSPAMNTDNITHSPRFHADKQRLTHRLRFYFSLLAQRAGIQWDEDNDAEIGDIAEFIARMVESAAFATLDAMQEQIHQLERETSDLRQDRKDLLRALKELSLLAHSRGLTEEEYRYARALIARMEER